MSLMMNNCLSGAHQAELAAGDLFDGRRIFAQPARFFPQPGVLGPQPREVGRQLIILFTGSHRRDQPLIADQRIDDEHAHDEKEQPAEDPAPARAA